MIRVIVSDGCLARDIDALCKIEPQFLEAYEATGPVPLRRRDGYSSLVRIIVGQQVSVASANAIWNRLDAAGLGSLGAILTARDEDLRGCGLSRQKAQYLRNLATANLDFATFEALPDDEIEKTLTHIKGIGPWTAQIYLMFSLGRADVFAPADLALQEAVRLLFSLDHRPNARELALISQNWSPHRNAAAQLLWAYYHVIKRRDGIGV